jgi:hypothetical protein
MLASQPASDKCYRVQHLLLGTLPDALEAAGDRLLVVVGVVESLPDKTRSDVHISADVMAMLTRCHRVCASSSARSSPVSGAFDLHYH